VVASLLDDAGGVAIHLGLNFWMDFVWIASRRALLAVAMTRGGKRFTIPLPALIPSLSISDFCARIV
jgi:hypothetical protein